MWQSTLKVGAVIAETLSPKLKMDFGRVMVYMESKILLVKGRSHVFIGERGWFWMYDSYQIRWVGGDR